MASKLKLKPLGGRVIVEPIEQEEMTEGHILAAGPGDRDDKGARVAMDVKVGDKVLFAKYSGTEVKMDGKKLLIMRESDILAIVEG
jgi:chaperonin GroES